jgi:hypothetical protein
MPQLFGGDGLAAVVLWTVDGVVAGPDVLSDVSGETLLAEGVAAGLLAELGGQEVADRA